MRGKFAESILIAVVFVAINLAGWWFQPQITYGHGKGWEGETYYRVAEEIARGEWPVAGEAPSVYRIGTPLLASLAHRFVLPGSDLFAAFRLVNVVANAFSLALLVAWLRRFLVDWRVRVALALAFLLPWDAPARWVYFYPVHTDPWMWVFLLGALLAVERCREGVTIGRLTSVALLSATGVVFREVVLVVPVALLFVENPWRQQGFRIPGPALWAPLAAALTTFVAVKTLARPTDGYAFIQTALHWLYAKPWPVYLHGWLMAFGPVVFLPIFFWRQGWKFLATHQHLAVYGIAFTVLGYVGGTDSERLLFWAMPVVAVLVGRALEGNPPLVLGSAPLLVLLAAAQALACRAIFWPTPDYSDGDPTPHLLPVLTPFGRRPPYLDLFTFFEDRRVEAFALAQYLFLGALILFWLNVRRRHLGRDWRASQRSVMFEGTGKPPP